MKSAAVALSEKKNLGSQSPLKAKIAESHAINDNFMADIKAKLNELD